jgi:hypothetical protein
MLGASTGECAPTVFSHAPPADLSSNSASPRRALMTPPKQPSAVCCRPTTHFQFTNTPMTHCHRPFPPSHERRCLPARPVSNPTTCFQLNFTNGASTAPFLTHRRSMTALSRGQAPAFRTPSIQTARQCPPLQTRAKLNAARFLFSNPPVITTPRECGSSPAPS